MKHGWKSGTAAEEIAVIIKSGTAQVASMRKRPDDRAARAGQGWSNHRIGYWWKSTSNRWRIEFAEGRAKAFNTPVGLTQSDWRAENKGKKHRTCNYHFPDFHISSSHRVSDITGLRFME